MAAAVNVQAATPAPRAYATEWNAEPQRMPVVQKESLVETLLARWEAAALRFGGDATTWRDTFALQLSMLPGTTLTELAAANPEGGFPEIYARVGEALRSVAETRSVRPKNLGQTTTDLVFVPINPCRIVDTRFGGGGFLSTGSSRNFVYANPPGNSFQAQGGANSNCGLAFTGTITPLPPKAIAATVTVVNASGSGNFVIYPAGASPGSTSALNYTAGAILANSTVIVGAQGGAADFTVALNGPPHTADIIVDAIGYYYAPAATALDCKKVRGTRFAIPANGSQTAFNAGAQPFCPAGYLSLSANAMDATTDVEGMTIAPSFALRSLRTQGGTSDDPYDANSLNCRYINNNAFEIYGQCDVVCCRIPGR